jgi:hypothetical protein
MVGLLATSAVAQQKLAVTVVDQLGAPVAGIKAESFSVSTDKGPRTVTDAVYREEPCTVILMAEASAFTKTQKSDIERLAILLISQLAPNEHMALYGYADGAELLQEFTTSKQALVSAVAGFRFENSVGMFDAVYPTLDAGFRGIPGCKILMLISGPHEGVNATKKQELVDLAERREVSVFAISLAGRSGLLPDVTLETGGALLSGRELKPFDQSTKNLFAAFRAHYELTVEGLELTGRVRVEVKGAKDKWQVTHRKE